MLAHRISSRRPPNGYHERYGSGVGEYTYPTNSIVDEVKIYESFLRQNEDSAAMIG